MKTSFCFVPLFLALCTPTLAADLPLAKPADVQMSAKKLDEGVQLFRNAVKRNELKGAVLLVMRNAKIVLFEPIGWRNEAKKQPMQRDTLFRMASNTKAVVATAVMMLADDGKLSLDDPVGKHLPAFNNKKCRGIRIRHLLSHTSGLRIKPLFLRPLMKPSKEHPHAPTLQLEVNRFAAVGPQKPPGTSYSYSNAGYNTLGAIVEVVSKQPLETFLTNRIYQPLGMTETTNHPVRSKLGRMCVVYGRNKKTKKWSVRFRQNARMRAPFVRASGGLVSTAADYLKFCQLFLNRGVHVRETSQGSSKNPGMSVRLLSEKAVAAMTRHQTLDAFTETARRKQRRFYGYGWFTFRNGAYGHSGSEGTYVWIDPKRNLIGMVLTQSPGGELHREDFRQAVTAACEEQKRGG
jgi:CubicO group peptidase (beta-lactamase class C family)